ncbi:MAG TPA: hypothetical protein DDZ67_04370 [Xanthomonadaceae bacterium]|nr:hypothetical protein [Xanthomonadaceae bacterium]
MAPFLFLRIALAVALLLPAALAPALAQTDARATGEAEAYRPATGDAWIDRQLADINAYARRYPDSFLDELARYAGVRRGYAQALLQEQRWQPGDLYFACFWTRAMNLSCREAVKAWSRDHRDGWEGVVGRLPVVPDNLHYRALRHAIVASYDRWERPIELDATLQRQLGDRDKRRKRALEAMEAAEAADASRL